MKKKLAEAVEAAAVEGDADLILLNSDLFPPLDYNLVTKICARKRRKNVIVILSSNGGFAEVAYRIARALQTNYTQVTVVIAGWCKSAGTIFCTGAHKIVFGVHGELGPIDVQIRREDEIGERDSGLSVDAAFESLSRATFKLFETFMFDIKEHSFGSITFKTAADIASSMAVGLVSPIFGQLDPIKIGETHRSVRIAEEYARRLAKGSRNLKSREGTSDAIEMLLRGYPAHGFVIDKAEAVALFERIEDINGKLAELVELLGASATTPVESRQGSNTGIAEFINAEPGSQTANIGGDGHPKARKRRGKAARTGNGEVRAGTS